MELQKFTRNPILIDAVQVTPTNVEEVAAWCKGEVTTYNYKMMGGYHKMGAILLPKQGPKKDKTRMVLIGNWITKHKNIFRCWSRDSFAEVYTPIGGSELKSGDLVRVNAGVDADAWEGWEGKILDAHLIGVSFGIRGNVVFEPSQVTKIDDMDSAQLEYNAGVEIKPGAGTPVEQILQEMSEQNKEELLAMERENLADDDIVIDDMVEVLDPTSSFFALHGVVEEIGQRRIETEDGKDSVLLIDYFVRFEDQVGLRQFNPKQVAKVKNYLTEPAMKTIDEFRKELGLGPAMKKGDQPISEEAQQLFKNMTLAQREVFVETQKRAEREIFGDVPQAHFLMHKNGEMEQLLPLDVSSVGRPNNADHSGIESLMNVNYSALVRGTEDPEFTKEMADSDQAKFYSAPEAEKVGKVLNNPFKEGDFVEVTGAQNAYHGYKGNVTMVASRHCRVRLDNGPEATINVEDLTLLLGGRGKLEENDMVEVNKPDSPFFGSIGRVTVVGVSECLHKNDDPCDCPADLVEVIVNVESHGKSEYANFEPNWLKKI